KKYDSRGVANRSVWNIKEKWVIKKFSWIKLSWKTANQDVSHLNIETLLSFMYLLL
ncbi:hypothetical protein CCACVL1_27303, partial [Corchorus capsularis]